MKHTKTQQKELLTAFGAVLTIALFVFLYNITFSDNTEGLHSAAPVESESESGKTTTLFDRRAQRLHQRLVRSGEELPEGILHAALSDRQEILGRTVKVNVTNDDGSESASWEFSPSDHPGILVLEKKWGGAKFEIDQDALVRYFETTPSAEMKAHATTHVTKIESDGYVMRANAPKVARAGFAYDAKKLAAQISDALYHGTEELSLELPYEEPYIDVELESGKQRLTLLGTGVSDYSNSPEARISNVHKAINERVNNVAIQKGEKFSFVATLGGPVTLDKGWKEALGLFGGGTAMTPGGGICQAATTVFRAALLSGMPITERRNHSVFVDHYEPYGVGLDATIFPGVHDLSFKNDTSSLIIMQAYTVGDDVFVNLYGVPDGRTVSLDGPYFAATKPRAKELAPLSTKQIGWVYHIDYGNGNIATRPFVATYHTGFMRSVGTRFAGTPGTSLLHDKDYNAVEHAAAPQPSL